MSNILEFNFPLSLTTILIIIFISVTIFIINKVINYNIQKFKS
jgi:hypothetical protein